MPIVIVYGLCTERPMSFFEALRAKYAHAFKAILGEREDALSVSFPQEHLHRQTVIILARFVLPVHFVGKEETTAKIARALTEATAEHFPGCHVECFAEPVAPFCHWDSIREFARAVSQDKRLCPICNHPMVPDGTQFVCHNCGETVP